MACLACKLIVVPFFFVELSDSVDFSSFLLLLLCPNSFDDLAVVCLDDLLMGLFVTEVGNSATGTSEGAVD